MADFTALKTSIQQYIKQNGNGEITGNLLQNILLSMVTNMGDSAINDLAAQITAEVQARTGADGTLSSGITSLNESLTALTNKVAEGYIYKGIATTSTVVGTILGKVFYLTATAGTYSNMGGVTVNAGISVISYNGSTWAVEQLLGMDNVPTENSQKMVKSGGVFSAIATEIARALAAETASVDFNSTTKYMQFKNSAGTVLYQFDATPFIIDGMVDNVEIVGGNLVISFNTDAGKQDIEIPLTEIFNPSNYYTKSDVDSLLQDLSASISTLNTQIASGYLYKGIATPSITPATPVTKEFYFATTAGTYTNFLDSSSAALVLTQGINILKHDGTAWSVEQVWGVDDNPTAGSNNLVKSGGVYNEFALGAVYDVSAKNPTAGPNNDGKWESLSALLSDANLNTLIPTSVRKGGMSIKFVQSSDNKYVQYRYISDTTTVAAFADVANWELDVTKKNLSDDFIGLLSEIKDLDIKNYNLQSDGKFGENNVIKHAVLPVNEGEVYFLIGEHKNCRAAFATSDSFSSGGDIPLVSGTSVISMPAIGQYYKFIIPQGCTYFLFNASGNYATRCFRHYDDLEEGTKLSVIKENLGIVSDFRGAKLSIIGDSISTFDGEGYKIDGYRMYYPYGDVMSVEQTYWKKLINVSHLKLEVNASYSGSCVTDIKQSQGYPDFYDRINLIGNPDVIIVALGRNDFVSEAELGTLDYDKDISSLSETNFCEAYLKGIKGLIANYPNAKIFCLSMKMGDVYKAIIKDIATHFGLHYLDCDGYNVGGMTAGHPNADGMDYIANILSNSIPTESIRVLSKKSELFDVSISSFIPQFEQGGLNNGSPTDRTDRIRTVDYIPVNRIIIAQVGVLHNYVMQAHFYDADKNFINHIDSRFSISINEYPQNAAYARFVVANNQRNPIASYNTGAEANTAIVPTDDYDFRILYNNGVYLSLKKEEKDRGNDIVNINFNFNIIPLCTYSNQYIQADGTKKNSKSWDLYTFDIISGLTAFKCKLWSSLSPQDFPYFAVAFYDENNDYISNSGLNFNDVPSGVETIIDNIPINAKKVCFANRKADGSAVLKTDISGALILTNSVINKQSDEITLLTGEITLLKSENEVLKSEQETEHFDSVGNAEFWLNGLSVAYSDMTWVGNKLIGFGNSSDDLTTEAGTIYINDYQNGVKENRVSLYTLKHFWGHCNTVDYNPNTDCLILGNGSGEYSLAGKIFIIPNFSSIVNVSESSSTPMSLDDVNALVIDCTSYNLGGKFNLIWGDDNNKNYNIAYLITANINGSTSENGDDLETIRKIVLRKGESAGEYGSIISNSTPFNGTFDIVETYHQITDGYPNCDQGTCYYNGEIYAAIGHNGLWYWRMRIANEKIYKKDYKQIAYYDTNRNASGICVKDGYLFIGRVNLGVMAIGL